MTLQRLFVNIPPEDLKPNSEFEDEIRRALGLPKTAEKIKAVYNVFNRWGDVLPIIFDIGVSINLTDFEQNINSGFAWWGKNFNMSKSARLDTKGGDPKSINEGVATWLKMEVEPKDWRLARIVKVIPTAQLLDRALQVDLANLHSSILSFDQLNQDWSHQIYKTWSDITSAYKPISGVHVRSGTRLDGLKLAYRDGSVSDHRGGAGGSLHEFNLGIDETIAAIMVWKSWECISGIQFLTTSGRISPHFGGLGGTPVLLVCPGSVVAGLSGFLTEIGDRYAICRLQAIWRIEVNSEILGYNTISSEYHGGTGGTPFNDWAYGGYPQQSRVSRIDIYSGIEVDGIQFTYSKKQNGGNSVTQAPHRGGRGGNKRLFELEPEEFIVSVSGAKNDDVLVRLCFTTSKGRTSEVFGGNGGTSFHCQPRTDDGKIMRLWFVAGKYGNLIDGLLFVWIPLSTGGVTS
ncbi:Jacalin-like lectin domain protein [Ceratobasidium sp. AG-Ba]|nr:Jacalin-like lectin domain protein [Ceratobasidium sp. AG-Ba]